jgi:hypothetical protein
LKSRTASPKPFAIWMFRVKTSAGTVEFCIFRNALFFWSDLRGQSKTGRF